MARQHCTHGKLAPTRAYPAWRRVLAGYDFGLVRQRLCDGETEDAPQCARAPRGGSAKQTRLVKLIAARTNELDQHGAESGLARHCQANRPDIDELTTAGESHPVVSEVSAHFAFFMLFHLAPELIEGCRGIGFERGCVLERKITYGVMSMHSVLNVRLRLLGIDPWISR